MAQRRPAGDETIFGFAARRIGREAAAAMIDAMVSGIFAGDARALSLRACFPRMWQLETDHGGLFKALIATRKRRRKDDAVGAPAGRLTSFDGGMEELIRALARSLGPALSTCTPVHALRPGRDSQGLRGGSAAAGFTLHSPGLSGIEADAVVLAGPALESAEIVRGFDGDLSRMLSDIPTAPLAVVCLGYDERALEADRGPLNGFGFLVPRVEAVRILGALWETSIYSRRAPAGKALLRVMIGGALDPDAVALDDESLLDIVRTDLATTMGLGIAPEFVRIIRHRRGIPQYTVGHLDRMREIETRLQAYPGLWLAGNSYRGVAINACIAEADGIAAQVVDHVRALSGLRAVS
jgi:oxygen-dependent protoporphyrinogen oxidase